MQRGIGVLDRKDMDAVAYIFVAYQKRGDATDPQRKYCHTGLYSKRVG